MRRRLLPLVWRVTPITPGKYTATPWWMGVAWYRLDTDSMVLVVLPLNLIVRALRSLMIGLRFPHAGRQVDAQIMYADGYAQGFADGATQVLADLHDTRSLTSEVEEVSHAERPVIVSLDPAQTCAEASEAIVWWSRDAFSVLIGEAETITLLRSNSASEIESRRARTAGSEPWWVFWYAAERNGIKLTAYLLCRRPDGEEHMLAIDTDLTAPNVRRMLFGPMLRGAREKLVTAGAQWTAGEVIT